MKPNPIRKGTRQTIHRNGHTTVPRITYFKAHRRAAWIYHCFKCDEDSKVGYRTRKIAKDAHYFHLMTEHPE